MKFLFLLFIAIAASAASVIKNPSDSYHEGDRYFYFSGDDGLMRIVDAEDPVDTAFIDDYMRNPENNAYWLYTRANPTTPQALVSGSNTTIMRSNFNPSKVTVFLAHGWNGRGENHMNKQLTQAFLQKEDVNVIVLDWSKLANRGYTTAKGGTAQVGKGMGQFINWLVSIGFTSYKRVHLVGFSLGGHLVGNAGRETEGAVARVTVLDPAGPLWTFDSNRVGATDGQYVEVIHTDTTLLGYTKPCGDADFYPNGGSQMPGCLVNSCSHSRSYEYMASSIKYNHLLANECNSYLQATLNRCSGDPVHMGNTDLNKTRRGIFRVNTDSSYPY